MGGSSAFRLEPVWALHLCVDAPMSLLCRRSDSCFNCKGPGGEDVSGGYYEAGGSFLKLGIVEAFLVGFIE